MSSRSHVAVKTAKRIEAVVRAHRARRASGGPVRVVGRHIRDARDDMEVTRATTSTARGHRVGRRNVRRCGRGRVDVRHARRCHEPAPALTTRWPSALATTSTARGHRVGRRNVRRCGHGRGDVRHARRSNEPAPALTTRWPSPLATTSTARGHRVDRRNVRHAVAVDVRHIMFQRSPPHATTSSTTWNSTRPSQGTAAVRARARRARGQCLRAHSCAQPPSA